MLNNEEVKKNTFYSGRNKRYLDEIKRFLDNEILIKGFYGSASFEIKVQDGIVQETTRDVRTKIVVNREQPKDNNHKTLNKKEFTKPPQTAVPFNGPRVVKAEQKAGIKNGN